MKPEPEISRVLFPSLSKISWMLNDIQDMIFFERWGHDHLSGTDVTVSLKRPTRPPGGPPDSDPIWTCSRWGLHCRPCHQDRGRLLPCHFTLTCDLQEVHRRYAFCCTFLNRRTGHRELPGTLPCGARTFLTCFHARPSGPFLITYMFILSSFPVRDLKSSYQ